MLETGTLLLQKYRILESISVGNIDDYLQCSDSYIYPRTILKGSMNAVYLALDESQGQHCIVKEIQKDVVIGGSCWQLDIRSKPAAEADDLKALEHPLLPKILDVLDLKNSFVIIREFIEGLPMNQAVDERGPFPESDILRWTRQICNLLQYLCKYVPPIICRKIRPTNIILRPDNSICLTGIGAVYITREFHPETHMLWDWWTLGDNHYAAPEQHYGMELYNIHTDIYNLGATIYYLATSNPPPGSDSSCPSFPSVLRSLMAVRETVTPSPRLQKLIIGCCSPVEYRYQNVDEVLHELNLLQQLGHRIKERTAKLNGEDLFRQRIHQARKKHKKLREKSKQRQKKSSCLPYPPSLSQDTLDATLWRFPNKPFVPVAAEPPEETASPVSDVSAESPAEE